MKNKDRTMQKMNTKSTSSPGPSRTGTPLEARFQAVFESSWDAIGVSKAGIHVFVNPAYLELFGFPRGTDLAGRPVLDLIAPGSRDQIRANILLREQGKAVPSTYETHGLRTDGSEFAMEVNVSQYQENGEDHTLVILRNINRRILAQEALRESEEKFRALVETSYDWIWAVDENGVYTYASPRVKEILGYAPDEVVGRTPFDFMPSKEREHITGEYGKIVAKRGPLVAFEKVNLHKDGREVILETSGMPIFDREGGFKGYRGNDRDITARKHAEAVLRISEERFRQVYLTSPDSININRLEDGMYISINQGFTATTGYTAADVIGKTSLELNLWVDPADRQKMVVGLRKQGEVKNLESRFRLKDGRIIDGLMSASIVEIDHIPHIISVTRDITERKQSELALKQSEEKYRRLYNETPVLLQSIDRDGNLVSVNDYWLQVLGYVRNEVIGKQATDFFTEASRKYAQEVILPAFFRDGIVKKIAYQFIKKNGDVLDALLSATAERDASGNVVRSLAVIEDVTERKRAEAKIIAYSTGLQRLLSISHEMTATADIDRLYRTAIQTAVDLLHFDFSTIMVLSDDRSMLTITDTLGFPLSMIGNFNLVEGQGLATHAVKNMMPESVVDFQTETRFEVPAIVRDLHIRSALCVPMILENRVFGVLIGHTLGQREFSHEDIATYQNIGNLAAIAITNAMNRKALHENQARLDLALQSAHMGVWRWEINENRRYFDDLTCQLLGINATTFTGTVEEFFQAVHPEDREKVEEAIARTLDLDVLYEPTYRIVWPDGSVRYITARGKLVRDDRKRPVRINGILWDITDQRLHEQEFIKSQKLESIGTLAGGIAHDFNNLLQGIFGFISMAKLNLEQKEKALAMLEQAEKALHQSVNLTSQLLTFSKGGKPVKTVFSLRPLIENAVRFALSGSRVTNEIITADGLCAVEADEGQLGQVIQNIVLNADQAMPLGGKIRISARNMPATALASQPDLQGDLVEISISDQGMGIPPEHLSRIFDPYFTTKEKGSGLGLASAYSIIKNHGGLIRVQSGVSKGTTFLIYLPASCAKAEEPKSPVIPAALRKGRILIMDDEEIVRAVAGELLTALGHEVAFAEKGEVALDAYQFARDTGRPFDIVILDLTIRGGMGGIETARKLAEIDPDVRAVVSSGYSDDAAMSDYRKQGFSAFLKKPYNVEELQRTLNALLA